MLEIEKGELRGSAFDRLMRWAAGAVVVLLLALGCVPALQRLGVL